MTAPPPRRLARLDPLPAASKEARVLARGVPERRLQRAIGQYADRFGWLYFHDPDARRCPACGTFRPDNRRRGLPDNLLCRPPYLVLAEGKTERGQLSPEQRAWLEALAGVKYLLVDTWRPAQWGAIAQFLADPAGFLLSRDAAHEHEHEHAPEEDDRHAP